MKIVDLSPTEEILEYTNWSRLYHAYGSAEDTPKHLRALLGDDERSIAHAVDHLIVATTHQGSYYPAADPAVLFVIAALDELDPQSVFYETLRSDLLKWLKFAGENFARESTITEEVIPKLLNLEFSSPTDYIELTNVLVAWVSTPHTRKYRRLVRNRLILELDSWLGSIIRWPLIDALGKLGHSVSRHLDDPDPIVRAFAAIHTHNRKGTRELNHSLAHITTWDPHYPAEVLQPLIRELLRRAKSIDEILPAAVAVMRHGNFRCNEWLELFMFTFKGQTKFTSTQRVMLKALAENNSVWSGGLVDTLRYRLSDLGLPSEREQLKKFLAL